MYSSTRSQFDKDDPPPPPPPEPPPPPPGHYIKEAEIPKPERLPVTPGTPLMPVRK